MLQRSWFIGRPGSPTRHTAVSPVRLRIAKLYASEAASEIIDQAVQVFGGFGVRKGTTVERLFRHSRAFRIFDGTSEIQQLVIAREMLRV